MNSLFDDDDFDAKVRAERKRRTTIAQDQEQRKTQYRTSRIEDQAFSYQSCGGGRRVIRKSAGGD